MLLSRFETDINGETLTASARGEPASSARRSRVGNLHLRRYTDAGRHLYQREELIRVMDDKALGQTANVAMCPGIVSASCAIPDAHWGHGFPIAGVAAFEADAAGLVLLA
jgi:hypothetical protein